MRFPHRSAAVASCLFASSLATFAVHAAEVGEVRIVGLDEPMTDNVRAALTLVEARGKELSGRRLAYLVREADNETREALQPFGYYSPTINVERSRGEGATTVTITVDPGQPVTVRRSHVAIEGEGGRDRYLK